MIIKKRIKWDLPLLCLSNSRGKEGPVEFLYFHVYTSINQITTYYRDEPNPEYEP